MKKFVPVLLGLMIIVFAGCNEGKALNGNWNTIAMYKDGVAQEIVESNIEMEVKGSVVKTGGCAGVNLFYGDVKMSNGKFIPSEYAYTKMMGVPAAMEFEDLFLTVIHYADSYELNDDILILKSSTKNVEMHLRKEK